MHEQKPGASDLNVVLYGDIILPNEYRLGAKADFPLHVTRIPDNASDAAKEAALMDADGRNVGRAILTQGPTGLLIRIEADGLTPGWHGAHIHATGQCAAPFTSAGGHINHGEPGAPHGLLNAHGRVGGAVTAAHPASRL